MKKKFLVLYILFILQANNLFALQGPAPHIITFFLRPASVMKKELDLENPTKNIHRTDKLVRHIITKDALMHLQSGIYATYFGSSTISDIHGQITFERKTTEPKISLLVTENITPVLADPLKPNVLTGFVLNPKATYEYYDLERIFDKKNKTYSWNTKKVDQSQSKNTKIAPETIIIFANPKHLIVHTGVTKTIGDENLFLPDIYVTQNTNSAFYALNFFKIRKYFAPVKLKYDFKENDIIQKVV